FWTQSRWEGLQRIKQNEKEQKEKEKKEKEQPKKVSEVNGYSEKAEKVFGTVGAIALDKNGNIAAGTSTGGMDNKKYGRVGDSPIIGAGTYANNETCGVSATGWGEFFIRVGVARDVASLMEYRALPVQDAADTTL